MKIYLRIFIFLVIFLVISSVTGSESVHAFLELDSAQELIAVINQYRIENNLHAFQTNGYLMAAAQGHSEWMAETGNIDHIETDGSTPKERAGAEGYGAGYYYWISELIVGGWNASPQDAINWWKASSLHNYYLLSDYYFDIGTGVATNGTWNYYTAVLGYIEEWEDPNNPPIATKTPTTVAPTKTPTEAPTAAPTSEPTPYPTSVPVVTATPNPDGSVIHIVQPGQYLSMIATAYGVSLESLYELNGLNQYSILYVGDQIIVIQADSPQPTPSPTNTFTPEPTDEITPTNTLVPEPTDEIAPTNTAPVSSGFATPTPMPDGSIIHILEPGQYLWHLSILYDIPLATILELNGLSEWSFVYPGDQIIIVPGFAPPVTATVLSPTPMPDGSIIHILEPGQYLWHLAILYDIPLATILELNGLYEWSLVYPGDQIIIVPGFAPAATATVIPPTATPTLLPTFTSTVVPPTETIMPEATQEITEVAATETEVEDDEQQVVIPLPTEPDNGQSDLSIDRDTMWIVLIILLGLLFMLLSFVLIFRKR
jgi:LysM repeat protein